MRNHRNEDATDILSDVHMPLENIAFALEDYMIRRGRELDGDTRTLLSGLRAAVGQVARSARTLSERADDGAVRPAPHVDQPAFAS